MTNMQQQICGRDQESYWAEWESTCMKCCLLHYTVVSEYAESYPPSRLNKLMNSKTA